MGNAGSPNSEGSQLFLNLAKNDFLDWFTAGDSKHVVFGRLRNLFQRGLRMSFDLRLEPPNPPCMPCRGSGESPELFEHGP